MQENSTINLLRSLHDLDLGALAHEGGMTGENLTQAQLDAIFRASTSGQDREMLAWEAMGSFPGTWAKAAQGVAALGAKVRAALPKEPAGPVHAALLDAFDKSEREARGALADLRGDQVSTAPLADQIRALPRPAAPTKPVPRVLQSADEAPCGSLVRVYGYLTIRRPDGTGWNLSRTGSRGAAYDPTEVTGDGGPWRWGGPCSPNNGTEAELLAEGLTETECRHLSGMSAADAVAWAEQRAKKAAFAQALDNVSATFARIGGTSKPRPQPGDAVPWAEVEDGALYAAGRRFRMSFRGTTGCMLDAEDPDIDVLLNGGYVGASGRKVAAWEYYPKAILVARDLGTDPKAWRQAMREWTANGNKPAAPPPDVSKERYEVTLDKVRQELGASTGDDIVIHARKVKARAVENERMLTSLAEITAIADRRLAALHEADERDSRTREALGAGDAESTLNMLRRVKREHECDRAAAAFEIKHLRLERDEARARVDSLRRHADKDRPPEF